MNKILKNMLVGLGLITLASCNDLEEYNPSTLSLQTLVSTPEGHTSIVNQAYRNLPSEIFGRDDGQQMFETGSDLWYMKGMAGAQTSSGWGRQMIVYLQLNEDQGTTKNIWQFNYESIRICNTAILHIDEANYSSIDVRNSREGEARFLRAFYYLILQEHFGGEKGIYLSTEEMNEPIFTSVRTPIEQVYELIFTDLNKAIELLPLKQSEHGRIEKKAAYGMLARSYLSYGSYYKYNKNDNTTANKYFEQTKETAEYIINNQTTLGCKLYDNFEDIFKNSDNCEEALYYMVNNETATLNGSRGSSIYTEFRWFDTDYSTLKGMQKSFEYGHDGNGRVRPTKYLLQLFGPYDGRYDASFNEVWRCNKAGDVLDGAYLTKWGIDLKYIDREVNIGDIVMQCTRQNVDPEEVKNRPYICAPINLMYDENGMIPNSEYRNCAPTLKKFLDPNRESSTTNQSTKDPIIIRLGEIYLIAAEACFHLGDENKALGYINILRDRAALSGHETENRVTSVDIANASCGGGYINFILDERARELCGERVRWNDLRRTRKLHERLGPETINPNIIHFENPKHYLRAIPIAIFLNSILNPNEFGQNDGWISSTI
ncbi:RagB/SusD family nutrient uptake outer membrane protein [termite gut metagenome]|jgi:hypothetical protein|uniref:RagB/SusD family nutrient uptake outer membrane protein n=1 Tax=termite gut metagenome TaxID=433724 RepID=A0A5J4SGP7_9ZZZZ